VGSLLVFSAAGFALALNGVYLLRQFESVGPFTYLSGEVSRDEYIASHRPEYPAIRYINENLSPDALVSFLFLGRRGYYCDRKYIHGEGRLETILKEAHRPEHIMEALSRSGITHLLIYDRLFRKWANVNFNASKIDTITEYTKIVHNEKGFMLLSLGKPSS
jgi:hypothetical protein